MWLIQLTIARVVLLLVFPIFLILFTRNFAHSKLLLHATYMNAALLL